MAEQILIRFEGPGSGTGALTWGQQQIWTAMQATETSQSLRVVQPLPPGKTAKDLAEELRFFTSRYESMRTRLCFGADGKPAQVVSDHGEAAVVIVEVADTADPEHAAEELADHWEATKFDYAREWPIRLAAIRHRGVDTHVVVVLSHLAADGGGAAVMMTELAERDPLTGLVEAPVTGVGPLELARLQQGPAAQRQSDSALRYWERLLRTATPQRFGPLTDRGEPRYRQVTLTSPAMHLAANSIAVQLSAATAPVLLAAFAIAVARVTGKNPVLTQAIVSNRFRPGLAGAIHPVSQNGLLLIDVADISLAEAVGRAQSASMAGSKHAYYDPARCDELCERIGVDIGCVYNDRRLATGIDSVPSLEQIRDALAQRELSWGRPLPLFNEKLMVTIGEAEAGLEVLAEVDTHYVAVSEVQAILLGMESVVAQAAFDPAGPTRVTAT